jgi:outer membrane protein assembly factor BamB
MAYWRVCKVYALAAASGAFKMVLRYGGSYIGSSAALANGMLYVGSTDQNLYAFGLP